LASKFFDCRCQKSAGILCVFQDFLAKAGGKFAVKMRAAAIGTASYNRPGEFRSCGSDQGAALDLPPFEKGGPKLCAPAALVW
jgi:hypothetical protein